MRELVCGKGGDRQRSAAERRERERGQTDSQNGVDVDGLNFVTRHGQLGEVVGKDLEGYRGSVPEGDARRSVQDGQELGVGRGGRRGRRGKRAGERQVRVSNAAEARRERQGYLPSGVRRSRGP